MKTIYLLIAGLFITLTNLNANQGLFCNHFQSSAANRGVESVASPGHVALMKKYDVGFYFLDLDIQRTAPFTISGNVLIRATSVDNTLDTFGIELASEFTVDSVKTTINNGTFQHSGFMRSGTSDVLVVLPSTAAAGQAVDVRVYYHGNPPSAAAGGAVFPGTNIFSASPPYNSSTWWPCKQSLTDKADSSWFFITTDSANVAVANGLLKNTVAVPGGKKRWEYKSKYPIDFYLVAFVVGTKAGMTRTVQYFQPTGRTDSMAVETFGAININNAVKALDIFSEHFGLYPFYDEKLALASVNLGGGMENQTIIAMGNVAAVIEHEIMHQWFGDHVTCYSYRDLWLNEGLARWGEAVYAEFAAANDSLGNVARMNTSNQFENGYPPYGWQGAVAWPDGSIKNFASDTNSANSLYGTQGRSMYYEKAAMMISSLRFEINDDDQFFQSLRDFLIEYGGGTATGADFIDAIETSTGMDLTDFFNNWYYGYGYPTFSLKWHQKNNRLALQVNHTGSSLNTPLFKTSLEVKIKRAVSDTTVRVFVNQNSQTFQLALGDSITGFTIDPNQWIANKTGTITKDTTLVIETAISNMNDAETVYTVYPNPTRDKVYISSSLHSNIAMNVELWNPFGQMIYKTSATEKQNINLSHLASGIYLLQINGTKPQKLFVVN